MARLKELIPLQDAFNWSDEELIAYWAKNQYQRAAIVSLLNRVTQELVNDMDYKYGHLVSSMEMSYWISENANKYTPDQLHALEIVHNQYITYGALCIRSYDKVKEAVENMECPDWFFRDCINYLHLVGIYFKNEDKSEDTVEFIRKSFINLQWFDKMDKDRQMEKEFKKQEAEIYGYVYEPSLVDWREIRGQDK